MVLVLSLEVRHTEATFTQSLVFSETNISPLSVFNNNIVHTLA